MISREAIVLKIRFLTTIQVNDGLPETSYLKMIDVWLFFNLLVPFSLIIIHTYMEKLR